MRLASRYWFGFLVWLLAAVAVITAGQHIRLIDLSWENAFGYAGTAAPSLTPDRSVGQAFKPGRPFLSFVEIRLATYNAAASGSIELILLRGSVPPQNQNELNQRLIARRAVELAHVRDNQLKRWFLPKSIHEANENLYLLITRPTMGSGQATVWLDRSDKWTGSSADVILMRNDRYQINPAPGHLVLTLGGDPPRLIEVVSWFWFILGLVFSLFLALMLIPDWSTARDFYNRLSRPGLIGQLHLSWTAPLDLILVIMFCLIGLYWTICLLTIPHPEMFLDTDVGNLVRWAMARYDPGPLIHDYILRDTSNFDNYTAIEVWLIAALHRLFGDYGIVLAIIAGATVFLQLTGHYLLAAAITKRRLTALLFTLAVAGYVNIGSGTYWGLPKGFHLLPRDMFEAILPFILLWAYLCRRQPLWSPVIMAVMGMMMYVHPVSAPTWGFALWLGSVVASPKSWRLSRKIGFAIGLGLLFLIACIPFLVTYFSTTSYGSHVELTAPECHILERNTFEALAGMFYSALDDPAQLVFFGLGVIGIIILSRRKELGEEVHLVAAWLAGVVIVGVGFTSIDQLATQALGLHQFQAQLVRTLRYLAPLLLLFTLWGLREIKFNYWMMTGLSFVVAAGWLLTHPIMAPTGLINCWEDGRLYCQRPLTEKQADMLGVLQAAAKTAPESLFFGADLAYQTRIFSRRPLVFGPSDNEFAIRQSEKTCWWNRINDRLINIDRDPDKVRRIQNLVILARELDADYMIINRIRWKLDKMDLEKLGLKISFANYYYGLIHLQ